MRLSEIYKDLVERNAQTPLMAMKSAISGLLSMGGFRIITGEDAPNLYGSLNAILFSETMNNKSYYYKLFMKEINEYSRDREREVRDWEDKNAHKIARIKKKLASMDDDDKDYTTLECQLRELLRSKPFDPVRDSYCSGSTTQQGLVRKASMGAKTITIFSQETDGIADPLNIANYGAKKGPQRSSRHIFLATSNEGDYVELGRSKAKDCVKKTFLRTNICGMCQPDYAANIFMGTAWTASDDGTTERFMWYFEPNGNGKKNGAKSVILEFKDTYNAIVKTGLDIISKLHKEKCETPMGYMDYELSDYHIGPVIPFENEELKADFLTWCGKKDLKRKDKHIARSYEKTACECLIQVFMDEIGSGNLDPSTWKITKNQLDTAKEQVELYGGFKQIKKLVPWELMSRYTKETTKWWKAPKKWLKVDPSAPGADDDKETFDPGEIPDEVERMKILSTYVDEDYAVDYERLRRRENSDISYMALEGAIIDGREFTADEEIKYRYIGDKKRKELDELKDSVQKKENTTPREMIVETNSAPLPTELPTKTPMAYQNSRSGERTYTELSDGEAIYRLQSMGIPQPPRGLSDGDFTRWGPNNRYSARWITNKENTAKGLKVWDLKNSEDWTLWPDSNTPTKILSFADIEAAKKKKEEEDQRKELANERLAEDIAAKLKTRELELIGNRNLHPYLSKKKVDGRNAYLANKDLKLGETLVKAGTLVLIMTDEYRITGAQQIVKAQGPNNKFFLKNSRTSGSFLRMTGDDETGPVVIAEGYATCISALAKFKGSIGYVTFSCHNMAEVTAIASEQLPGRPIMICADNGKAGVDAANESLDAIKDVGGEAIIALPRIEYSDFNDEANDVKSSPEEIEKFKIAKNI